MNFKIKNVLFYMLVSVAGLVSCEQKQPNASVSDIPVEKTGNAFAVIDSGDINTPSVTSVTSATTAIPPLKTETGKTQISTAGTKTYYDKINNVSVLYPETWVPEYNEYVAFKIDSPQENEKDSMKENFFYAVLEENPTTTNTIKPQPKATFLTLDQMAMKMQNELTIETANRKNCKILSCVKTSLNGVPAYELISTGLIKGISMKYRIVAMKLGTKQYYLYFSAEESKFDRYQKEANLIFGSFLVK